MQATIKIPGDLDNLRAKIRQSVNEENRVILGKYAFVSWLGGGNYGDVYKAIHLTTKKYFAIKIIDKKVLKDSNPDPYVRTVLGRLLETEGALMQLCDSPHVVKCFDIIENQRYKILVLEFCNKGSLDDELKKKNALPVEYALAILKQIILGIAELHRNKIIHRDLKPENIMIHNGRYKIGDFGFSKKIQNENQTKQHTCLGTKATMAPEVKARQKYGIKADIWSIGVIFYTMICSNYNYGKDGYISRTKDIQQQIMEGRDAKQLFFKTVDGNPDMELKQFILQMLTIDHRKRISWRELVTHKIFERNNGKLFPSLVYNPSIIETGKNTIQQVDEEERTDIQHENLLPNNKTLEQAKKKKSQNPSLSIEEEIKDKLNETFALEIVQFDTISDVPVKQSEIEQKIYKQMKQNNLDCQKAQYIYQKIILEIENKKMLDQTKKKHMEMLYLMYTRCYTNVSWAANIIKKHANDEVFVNYQQQIKQLYRTIYKAREEFSDKLKKVEDQVGNVFKDIGSSVFRRKWKKEHDALLGGIEITDYTKQQQIEYTQNEYIEKIIPQLKGNKTDLLQIKRKLECYKKINEVKLQEIEQKGTTFLDTVKQILIQ